MAAPFNPPALEISQEIESGMQKRLPVTPNGKLSACARELSQIFGQALKVGESNGEVVKIETYGQDAICLRSFAPGDSGHLLPRASVILQGGGHGQWSYESQGVAQNVNSLCLALIAEIGILHEEELQAPVHPTVAAVDQVLTGFKGRLEAYQKAIQSLERELSVADQAIRALEQLLEKASQKAKDAQHTAQSLQNQNQALVERATEAEHSATIYKDENTLLRRLNQQLQPAADSVPELEQQIKTLQEEHGEKQQIILKLTEELRKLQEQTQKQLAEAHSQIDETNEKLISEQQKNQQLESQLKEALEREALLKAEVSSLKTENTELLEQIDKLKAEIEDLRTKLEFTARQIESLERDLKALTAQKNTLEESLEIVAAAPLTLEDLEPEVIHVIEDFSEELQKMQGDLRKIAEGRLEMLFAPTEALMHQVEEALLPLLSLQNLSKEDVLAVHNFALYLANASSPQLQRQQPLYEQLRVWILTRAANKQSYVEEASKLQALLITLADHPNCQIADIAEPLRFLQQTNFLAEEDPITKALFLRLMRLPNSGNAAMLNRSMLSLVREFRHNPNPDSFLEKVIHRLISEQVKALTAQFEYPGDLSIPDLDQVDLSAKPPKKPNLSNPNSYLAIAQYLDTPPPRQDSRISALGGGWTQDESWKQRLDACEAAFEEVLKAPIAPHQYRQILIQVRAEGNTPIEKPSEINPHQTLTQNIPDLFATPFDKDHLLHFNEDTQSYDRLSDHSIRRMADLEREMEQTLAKITGMRGSSAQQLATTFSLAVGHKQLPPLLQKVASQGDASELAYLLLLVYYYTAFSHLNPAKPRFASFAKHSDWAWLFEKMSGAAPTEVFMTLIASFYQHPQLAGSVLTALQTAWTQNIFSFLMNEKFEDVYDEAGSGKTLTLLFAAQLLNNLLTDPVQFHLLSPFGQNVQGLVCHQFLSQQQQILIDGSDADRVGIDEGDAANPDLEIIIGHPGVVVERPFLTTATPIDTYYGQDSIRARLDDFLRHEAESLEKSIEDLEHQISDAATEAIATYRKELVEQIQKMANPPSFIVAHLPNARQKKGKEILKRISEGQATPEDIDTMLELMSYILLPTEVSQRKASIFKQSAETSLMFPLPRPQLVKGEEISDYHSIDTTGCLYSKKLREDALWNKAQYESTMKAFLRFTNTMISLRNLKEADPDHLPEKIKNKMKPEDLEKMIRLGRYRTQLAEFQQKIQKHEALQKRAKEQDEELSSQADYIIQLPQMQKRYFDAMEYTAAASQPFSAASLQTALEHLPQDLNPTVQLVFPGIRFTQEHLQTIYDAVGAQVGQRPRYFVYHDSHSPQGSDHYGKNWVYDAEHNTIIPMRELEQMVRTKTLPQDALIILLYDTTNKQGGDFNSLSHASDRNPISQYLFYHLTEDATPHPMEQLTLNNLYQSLRRRRGDITPPAVVISSNASKDYFLEIAKEGQKALRKERIAGCAATTILNKLLKLCMMITDPESYHQYHQARQIEKDPSKAPQGNSGVRKARDSRRAVRLVEKHFPGIDKMALSKALKKMILQVPEDVDGVDQAMACLRKQAQDTPKEQQTPLECLVAATLLPLQTLESSLRQDLLPRVRKTWQEIGSHVFRAAVPMQRDQIIVLT